MKTYFKITGLGRAFDGLIVESEKLLDTWQPVNRIINSDVMFGDRNASLALPPDAMLINEEFLEVCDNPELREYSSKSSYGKFELEGRYSCGKVEVAFSQYEKCLQVTLLEVPSKKGQGVTKTLYSENYTNTNNFDDIKDSIQVHVKNSEVDDIIFQLQEWKCAEQG